MELKVANLSRNALPTFEEKPSLENYSILLKTASLVRDWAETTEAAMLVSLCGDVLQVLRTIPSSEQQNYVLLKI